ncbi:hypothetical protein Bca101_083427 [Brassica carinata]
MAKGLFVEICWDGAGKVFLVVALCLKRIARLVIGAERATTKGASAGLDEKEMARGEGGSGGGYWGEGGDG